MRKSKKLLSWLLSLAVALTLLAGTAQTAHAADASVYLRCSGDSGTLTVELVAGSPFNVAGFGGYLRFDSDAFSLTGGSSPIGGYMLNTNTMKFTADNAYGMDMEAGDVLLHAPEFDCLNFRNLIRSPRRPRSQRLHRLRLPRPPQRLHLRLRPLRRPRRWRR